MIACKGVDRNVLRRTLQHAVHDCLEIHSAFVVGAGVINVAEVDEHVWLIRLDLTQDASRRLCAGSPVADKPDPGVGFDRDDFRTDSGRADIGNLRPRSERTEVFGVFLQDSDPFRVAFTAGLQLIPDVGLRRCVSENFGPAVAQAEAGAYFRILPDGHCLESCALLLLEGGVAAPPRDALSVTHGYSLRRGFESDTRPFAWCLHGRTRRLTLCVDSASEIGNSRLVDREQRISERTRPVLHARPPFTEYFPARPSSGPANDPLSPAGAGRKLARADQDAVRPAGFLKRCRTVPPSTRRAGYRGREDCLKNYRQARQGRICRRVHI